MGLIIVVAIVVAVAVLPVMFAARLVGAGRPGFGWSFVAIVIQSIASGVTRGSASNPLVALVVAVVVGSAIYALILDTTFVRGLLIGVIATVIAVIVVFVLATVFATSGAAI